MSSFTSPLDIEYIDGRSYRLLTEFDYVAGDGVTIHVPKGFITDFASIPRFLWAILPPTGKYGKAAVVHDYLYQTGGRNAGSLNYSKAQSDKIFLEAMGVLGVNSFLRYTMYLAVSLFGHGSFLG